jgi:hypothetical protein
MKKTILFLMLTLVGFGTFSQISVDSTTTVTQKEELNPLYSTGKDILEKTAIGAGEVLTTGYEVLVIQQKVKAITYLIPLIVGIILIGLSVWFYTKATTENNRLTPAILFGIIGLSLSIWGSVHWEDITVGLINPQYAAIKDFVSFGKEFTATKTGN